MVMESNNPSLLIQRIETVLKSLLRSPSNVTSTHLDAVLRGVLKDLSSGRMSKVGRDHNEYQELRRLQKKEFGRQTQHDRRVRELYPHYLLFEKLEELKSSIKKVQNREMKARRANTQSHDIRRFVSSRNSNHTGVVRNQSSSNQVWNPYTKKYIDRAPLQTRSNLHLNHYKRDDNHGGNSSDGSSNDHCLGNSSDTGSGGSV